MRRVLLWKYFIEVYCTGAPSLLGDLLMKCTEPSLLGDLLMEVYISLKCIEPSLLGDLLMEVY